LLRRIEYLCPIGDEGFVEEGRVIEWLRCFTLLAFTDALESTGGATTKIME
jgi:hypothetical protein